MKKILTVFTLSIFILLMSLFLVKQYLKSELDNSCFLVLKATNQNNIKVYNIYLDSNDIVFTYGYKPILKKVKTARKMISAGNLEDLQKEINEIKDVQIDFLNYNPEHWGKNNIPKSEIDNIIQSIKKAKKLSVENNMKLSFITDNTLFEDCVSQAALFVDMFGVQLQRFQLDGIDVLEKEGRERFNKIKNSNPNVPVILQLCVAPAVWETKILPDGLKKKVHKRDAKGNKITKLLTKEELLKQINALSFSDGIAFLFGSQEEVEVLYEVIKSMR